MSLNQLHYVARSETEPAVVDPPRTGLEHPLTQFGTDPRSVSLTPSNWTFRETGERES
jgi:hypothetical protein